MSPPIRLLLLGAFLVMALAACSTVPQPGTPPPPSRLESLVSPHKAKAEQLEAQGDLRGAFNEWKIALTIDPKDEISMQGKKRVEERINQAVADALSRGREALKRRINLEARRHFLTVLALDPANKAAFDALQTEAREIRLLNHTVRKGDTLASIAEFYYGDRSRSEVIWETNQLPANPKLTLGMILKIPEIPGVAFRPQGPSREPRAAAPVPVESAKPEPTEEEEVYVNPLLADAREALERGELSLALADVDKFLGQNPRNAEGAELKRTVLYQQGKVMLDQRKYAESYTALNQLAKLSPNYQDASSLLDRAKSQLVQQHYNQGIRLYREEKLEPAIAEWRTVLQYDPSHEAAKKNIEQAERLLRGLQQRQQKK